MAQHIAHDLEYGDMGCLNSKNFNSSITDEKYCSHITHENK